MFTCYFNFTYLIHFACVQRALNILERSILFTQLDVVFLAKKLYCSFLASKIPGRRWKTVNKKKKFLTKELQGRFRWLRVEYMLEKVQNK